MEAATVQAGFGALLREWRGRRSLSQLELSLESRISARHLSFVETGRSQPSRETVARLAEALEVPLRERNALLLAAGYAPVYPERPFGSQELEPIRSALDRFLRAHEPYPALVVDRRHNLLASNDALSALTGGCAPWLFEPPANVIRIALHPEGMASRTGEPRRVERPPARAAASRGGDHGRPGARGAPRRGRRLSGCGLRAARGRHARR